MDSNLTPEIKQLHEKKLVGLSLSMSFANNLTGELWKNFMPRRKEIQNGIGTDLYSMQIYGAGFFEKFNPQKEFVKWACIEVPDFENIPEGMKDFTLRDGLYAVFHYKGDAKNAAELFQYILGKWLPSSGYSLDIRPHFEVLGEKYKKDHPDSEEEIWIPIK